MARRPATVDEAVAFALMGVPAPVRSRFAANPVVSLVDDFHLTVRPVGALAETRADGGFCDGLSFIGDGVILYSPSPFSRREDFTLAHELGHMLVERSTIVLDWIADSDHDGELLETVCDRVAQLLLLPDATVDAIIGAAAPSARHVRELFDITSASEPVCMIAVGKRINGLGAIALIDRATREVTGASVRPDPDRGWPNVFPWRGQKLPFGHRFLERLEGSSFTERTIWRNAWNDEAEFFVDGFVGPTKLILVFAETDVWDATSAAPLIDRTFDTRPALRGHCCGRDFEIHGYPCSTCGGPFCPRCGDCRCGKAAARDVTCKECFLQRPAHLVLDGVCNDCRG